VLVLGVLGVLTFALIPIKINRSLFGGGGGGGG
jgi:hypothetical protein